MDVVDAVPNTALPHQKPTAQDLCEMRLNELLDAEMIVLRCAFSLFDERRVGIVRQDHMLLLSYICEHTVLTEETVEVEINNAAINGHLTVHAFASLLQRNRLRRNEGATLWVRTCRSRWEICVEEGRAALRDMLVEGYGCDPEQAEDILDSAMRNCVVSVTAEEWLLLTEHVSCLFRVLKQLPCI